MPQGEMSQQEAVERMLQAAAKKQAPYIARELGKTESRKVPLEEAGGWARVFLGQQWLANYIFTAEGLPAIKSGLEMVVRCHGLDSIHTRITPQTPRSAHAAWDALTTMSRIKDRRYTVQATFRLAWLIEHVQSMLNWHAAETHRTKTQKLQDSHRTPHHKKVHAMAVYHELLLAEQSKPRKAKKATLQNEVYKRTGVKPRTLREHLKDVFGPSKKSLARRSRAND